MTPLRPFGGPEETESVNRHGFTLELERLDGFGLYRLSDERERLGADQHFPRLRGLLQPRRHVDRVAGREPLLGAGEHFAGVDANSALDPELR